MSGAASSTGWLDGLGAGLAQYAEAAYRGTSEAGEALGAQLADALARVQTLPGEAAAAVDALMAAVDSLFPVDAIDDPVPAPVPTAPGYDVSAGPGGGIEGTVRPAPRRLRVEPAAFAAFIRARHPAKPAEHCAALTGIPLDSVDKMLKRETLPNGRNFLRCVVAYGPDLIAAVLPEADERWLTGAQILADQVRLDDELARTRAEIARNSGRWIFLGLSFGGGT